MRIYIYEHVSAGGMGEETPESLRREGQAMLDAVASDFERVPGVVVERMTGPCFEKIDSPFFALVIAPELDGILERLSQAVLDAGGRLLGATPRAIGLTGDKLATAEFWRSRDVPHPPTALYTAPLTRNGVVTIVKPRHGAGTLVTFRVRNRHDDALLAQALRGRSELAFIVQPYIAGQAASISLLMSPTQTIPLLPARQHLSHDCRFHYLGGSLPLPGALADRAVKLALQAVAGIDGLFGYVGVDLVLGDDGNDYAIEINPRLTTSYLGLRQLCQQNLAELILSQALGETIAPPTWNAGELCFRA